MLSQRGRRVGHSWWAELARVEGEELVRRAVLVDRSEEGGGGLHQSREVATGEGRRRRPDGEDGGERERGAVQRGEGGL